MNVKRKVLSILASISIIFTSTCIGVDASEEVFIDTNQQMKNVEEYPEELEPYAQELDKINQKLGTEYSFDFENSSDEEVEESVSFYTAMNIEEFSEYMTNAIIKAEETFASHQIKLVPCYESSIILPLSSTYTQRWYYNNSTSGNSLQVTSSVNYYNSTAYYVPSASVSLYDSYSPNIYPYFIHTSGYKSEFSSNNRTLYLSVPGKVYSSKNASAQTTLFTLQFTAGVPSYFSSIS